MLNMTKAIPAGQADGMTYLVYPEHGTIFRRKAYKSDPKSRVSARALEGIVSAWHRDPSLPFELFGIIKVLDRNHPDIFERWRITQKGARHANFDASGKNPLVYSKIEARHGFDGLRIGWRCAEGDIKYESLFRSGVARRSELWLAAPGLLFGQTPEGGWEKYAKQWEDTNLKFRKVLQSLKGCAVARKDGTWITLSGTGGSGWVGHEKRPKDLKTVTFYTDIVGVELPDFIKEVQARPKQDLNSSEMWVQSIRNFRPTDDPELYEMIGCDGVSMGQCTADGALEVVGLKLRE